MFQDLLSEMEFAGFLKKVPGFKSSHFLLSENIKCDYFPALNDRVNEMEGKFVKVKGVGFYEEGKLKYFRANEIIGKAEN